MVCTGKQAARFSKLPSQLFKFITANHIGRLFRLFPVIPDVADSAARNRQWPS